LTRSTILGLLPVPEHRGFNVDDHRRDSAAAEMLGAVKSNVEKRLGVLAGPTS
jgi:hypothetical protein